MGETEALPLALTRTRAAIRRGVDALLAAGLAARCAACACALDRPLDGPVCAACWHDAAQADGRYDGALRRIIHAFKYEGRRSLAAPLGALLRSHAEPLLPGVDCVMPVPLHPWRRFRRGFNQAADLAGALGPPVVHGVWRIRHTAPQTGLTAAERRRNVHAAFTISPLLSRRSRAAFIEGRTILLVDDVRTTGATLQACAAVLSRAGAAEVRQVTLARAPLRP